MDGGGTPFGARFCEALRDRGVERIFGIPGVHNQELYRSLTGSDLSHLLARHEQGACFMADGYARATGKPGIAFVITGPGLTNGLTAIGQAYSDSIPVLVVASCLEDSERGPGTGVLHKLKDQAATGDGVADWCLTAESHGEAYALLDRALDEFAGCRPRPKILNLPVGLLSQPASPPPLPPPARCSLPAADVSLVRECADALRRASRPLFVFGGGAVGAVREARQVLGLSSAAAFTTYAGRGILPAEYGLGFGSYLARPESEAVCASADLVLAVGTELSQVDLLRGELGHRGAAVRVDIDPEVLSLTDGNTIAVQSDARRFLAALAAELEGEKLATGWTEAEAADARRRFRASCDADRPGIARIAEALTASLPDDAIVFSDMTQFAYVAKEVAPARNVGGWHHPYGFGTLGYALPAAVGAKAGLPERPVLAIAGDYGFQYTLQELGTAAELALPLAIIVWDNQALQEIADSMERSQIEPTAVKAFNPDFPSLAASYGLLTSSPQSLAQFIAAVADALQADRPTLIHADTRKIVGRSEA